MLNFLFFNKISFLHFKAYNFQMKGTRNNPPGYNMSCSFLPQLRYSSGHVPFLGYSETKRTQAHSANHSSKTKKNWVNHLICTLVAKRERQGKKKDY